MCINVRYTFVCIMRIKCDELLERDKFNKNVKHKIYLLYLSVTNFDTDNK